MPKFSGVIPPLVSPLLASDQLDVKSVDRIVEHLIAGGVSGLFVLGTTGEGPSLTYQMRYEMVERTCEAADGRIPVLVAVTDTSLAESIALAQHAAECGAAAVVAAPPFYFDVPQSALQQWFSHLADRSPVPLMLYNMPSCVGVVIDLTVVNALSHHPNILGIKDSGGDMAYFEELCKHHRDRDDFVIFMGPEERLAEAVALGAAGGVCGGANLCPEVYSRLYQAAVRNDENEIRFWNQTIHEIFQTVYRNEDGIMRLIPGLKHAMALRGLCSPTIAPPLPPLSESHAQKISRHLEQLVAFSLTEEIPVVA
ncbi:MAG: dihydrodipicolinate synthase family protein [Planctomycetota bacterium]